MMNIYRVISETLWATIPLLEDGTGPEEPWAIVELVAAETRAKAKWMVWRASKIYEGDPREMPKFSVRKVATGVDVPAGILTSAPEYEHLWSDEPAEVTP